MKSHNQGQEPDKHADEAAQAIVHVRELDKQFGGRQILNKANMDLFAGESTALLGESGAGKSTLLNILAGLEAADHGTVRIAGHSLNEAAFDPDRSAAIRRQSIGFVFQAFHLLPHLSVWQNIALPLLLNGLTPAQARESVDEMLTRVGLASQGEVRPAVLSGGEQQRVCLARALIHQPALLLADEPTGNLDPQTAARALGLMQEVVEQSGCAMLMVTHSEQAAAICQRRLMLADGKLVPASIT